MARLALCDTPARCRRPRPHLLYIRSGEGTRPGTLPDVESEAILDGCSPHIMAELGEFETTEHTAIGSLAAELGMPVVAADTPDTPTATTPR